MGSEKTLLREIESMRRKVKLDVPVYIGVHVVCNYQKLRLFAFAHDFVNRFIEKNYTPFVLIDTDLLTIFIDKVRKRERER